MIHIAKLRKKKNQKLGLRECKQLGQSYAVSMWQGHCSKPDTSYFRARGLPGCHMFLRRPLPFPASVSLCRLLPKLALSASLKVSSLIPKPCSPSVRK